MKFLGDRLVSAHGADNKWNHRQRTSHGHLSKPPAKKAMKAMRP